MATQVTFPQSRQNDCLAFCAPGVVLTAVFFMERVELSPTPKPATASAAGLKADEIYDLLLEPQTGPVDRLILLSPHVLFNIANPVESFAQCVRLEQMTAEPSWHYPERPRISHDTTVVVVTNKPPHIEPGTPFLETYEGQLASGRVSLPEELMTLEGLAAMFGLGKTIFECKLACPIQVGERCWLRFRICPAELRPPGQLLYHQVRGGVEPSTDFEQLHDILGADVLLESLRDILATTLGSKDSLPISLPDLDDSSVKNGLCDFHTSALKLGFGKAGTYTRILNHRIMLVSDQLIITPLSIEGSVRLEEITVPKAIGRVAYNWSAGLKFFSGRDPIEAENQIYDYVKHYADDPKTAKSMQDITYASQVDHILGCLIIELFHRWGYFLSEDGGETFYLNKLNLLPNTFVARCPLFLKVAEEVARKIRPGKAHFRIYFSCRWQQRTLEDIALGLAIWREKRFFQGLIILGLILGILNLCLRLIH